MIYCFGGGAGFLGSVFKQVTSMVTGPATLGKDKASALDDAAARAAERKRQEEAERRDRARAQNRSGRNASLLSGGGTTAGVASKKPTLLGSVRS